MLSPIYMRYKCTRAAIKTLINKAILSRKQRPLRSSAIDITHGVTVTTASQQKFTPTLSSD